MKRANKEDNMWDCSVCTYRNSPEAFKCLMCDVRKGTSTRKPRLNAELVAAQVAQVIPPKPKKTIDRNKKFEGKSTFRGRPRLKNVDRSTAEHNAVTVNNVTVIITEFQPKQKSASASGSSSTNGLSSASSSHHNSSNVNSSEFENSNHLATSSEAGSISDTSESKHSTKAESTSPA